MMMVNMRFDSFGWIDAIAACWFAYLGASIGSFSNVVASRWPRGESIVHPGSRCPACLTPIRWYDNVPVIGWLILRGRCRSCHWPIPARYVLVEILFAVVFVILYLVDIRLAHSHRPFDFLIEGRWSLLVPFVRDAFLISTLLVIALIRTDHLRVPLGLLLSAAGILWGVSIFDFGLHTETTPAERILSATIGGAMGMAIYWVAHRTLSSSEPVIDISALHPDDFSGLVLAGIVLGPTRLMVAAGLMMIFGLILRAMSMQSIRQGIVPLATLVTIVSPFPHAFR
jgi:leader peptidase (prepilin peptidase)/N-methyltransferase